MFIKCDVIFYYTVHIEVIANQFSIFEFRIGDIV